MKYILRVLPAVLLFPLLLACSEDTTEPEPLPVPGAIVITGNGQTGTAGSTLPIPLGVRITTAAGAPVAGQRFRASVAVGGGTISPESGTTGADGSVSASWTLGPVAGGVQKVIVEALSESGAVIVTAEATATAVAGPAAVVQITPASLAPFSSSGRTSQLSAVARDALGNVDTSGLNPGEYAMLVRVVMSNGRYNEVRGVAIITP